MQQGDPSDFLFDRLRLDPTTGKVYWRDPTRYHKRLAGQEAGCPRPSGSGKPYWMVKLGGKAVHRSRIVFCMIHGRWPEPCVDHINGDSLDDRPENLREATITENAWNHKTRSKASDLPMGVRQLGDKFQARISCNKVARYLGVYSTADEASIAYQLARKEMFRDFA